MLLRFFLNIFFCLVPILFRLSIQKHLPLSNNVILTGHINFIVPVNNFINDYILLSSFNGNVSLFNYKTGEHRWIKNHREEEKVKKLHGDEEHATVLIYRNNCEEKEYETIIEENNFYFYINVYNIVSSDLINTYEYREEITNFTKQGDVIVLVFKERIEIGNINDNILQYIYFKDLNIQFDFIYVNILQFEKSKNRLFLFCIDKKEAVPYIIHINIDAENSPKVIRITKINELTLNKKRKHFIRIYNNHLIIIYNKKFLYWIGILEWENNTYVYDYETVNEKDENELFEEEKTFINENFFIETEEETEGEITNGGTFLKSDGHIIINIFGEKVQYFYLENKLKFIKKLRENEIKGYYFKNGKKQVIIARDENKEIYIEEPNINEKAQINLHILKKSENVLYNAELIVGLYNSAEKKDYFLTVYNDSSFTVYVDKEPIYSREEALIYIEQAYFHNFQHLRTGKEQGTYPWNLGIFKKIKKFIKGKIDMLHVYNNIDGNQSKNEKRNSMLPFNLFYLKNEEKMKLLKIAEEKKANNNLFSFIKKENEEEQEINKDNNLYNKKDIFLLMNQLFNDVYETVLLHRSVKYSWNYIILVSTYNGFIFAFHLSTGLILYKIDLNQFKKKNEVLFKESLCSYDLTNNSWGEMQGGRKVIFLENIEDEEKQTYSNNTDTYENENNNINNIKKRKKKKKIYKRESELSPFRMYSKDSVITIYKSGGSSTILIFDILNGNFLFKKQLPSFQIEHFFILPNSKSLIVVDHLLNIEIINVLNKNVVENINERELYFYNVNTLNNNIRGYKITSIDNTNEVSKNINEMRKKIHAIETYKINMNEEEIEVIATSKTRKKIYFPVKINVDASIQYKYINNNIICYITKSINKKTSFYYVLYIIDGVSGKYLFSKILDKFAKPPFHILINENFVIVNYFHININKYVIYIMELLLDKKDPGFLNIITSKKEKIAYLFHDENVMINEKQYVIDYNIRSFSFTETKHGITNKHLILLLDTNKIAPLTISDGYNNNFYKKVNKYISETNILYNSTGILLNESSLESTTLLLSWGNYIYFTSYQPNGSYDTIENYNTFFLLLVIIFVFVATLLSYVKRIDKKLHAHWA